MIAIFFYFLVCSFKNRAVSFFRRLRQPKYLISALAGLAYVYFFFFRQMFTRPRGRVPGPLPPDLGALPLLEIGGALALCVFVLLPWIWPGRSSGGLRFSEAEIQFLFPAPISRRALIHFRLVRMQLGLVFGVLISFLFFGRGGMFAHPAYFLVTLWAVYSFLGLYYIGTSLAQMSLSEHGISGIKRQSWVLAAVVAVIAAIIVWLKWFIPPLPGAPTARVTDFPSWLLRATESGPAYYFLAPFKALVHPAFAPDPLAFLLRLVPALAILGIVYLWVIRSDVAFEEASLERARKLASQMAAARSGSLRSFRRSIPKMRRPLFKLSAAGFAHTPILWKNLISIGRLDLLRVLPAIVSVGVAFAVILVSRGGQRDFVPTLFGSLAGMMAGFLALIGPLLVRDDFRTDLLRADLLKTYPIAGWSMALGQVLAPAAVLAAAEWILLGIAALLLPSVGRFHPSAAERFLVGLSAALLLPCFSLLGVLIQNAAALIMPDWVQLGKEHRQGIEAMGQRIITMAATVLLLVFAVLPAALVFAVAYFAGSRLIGLAALPIASLLAALGLLAEAGLTIFWLGRLYDKLDISLERITR